MKTENYYKLATPRKMRRQLRKVCKKGPFGSIGKSTLILKNDQGQNILKVRRIKGRILQSENA